MRREKDEKKAFELYHKSAEKSAEKSDFYSVCNLARCYMEGVGIEKDDMKGVELYEKGAEKGNLEAIQVLDLLCRDGGVVKEEVDKVASYFLRSHSYEELEDLISTRKVHWTKELHRCWLLGPQFRKERKELNLAVLTLLLVSNQRGLSKFAYVSSMVKGVTTDVIKFLCHFTNEKMKSYFTHPIFLLFVSPKNPTERSYLNLTPNSQVN